MKFRPCIDIHNGKVKQIVGGSLKDEGDQASENFVSEMNAADYANKYAADGLKGGHVILLNPPSSDYYEATAFQAKAALSACPGTLQVGGGIRPENAEVFLDAGASHVIVTSYVFTDGRIDYDNLDRMIRTVGKEHLVLDLSCRKKDDEYVIVTDRWQKFTKTVLNEDVLSELAGKCDEFLIHAVDVEGKAKGPERDLVLLLGKWHACPITYAGGIGSYEDLEHIRADGRGYVDFTIGSALDLFGGELSYDLIKSYR